jgi:hypothetical protein
MNTADMVRVKLLHLKRKHKLSIIEESELSYPFDTLLNSQFVHIHKDNVKKWIKKEFLDIYTR